MLLGKGVIVLPRFAERTSDHGATEQVMRMLPGKKGRLVVHYGEPGMRSWQVNRSQRFGGIWWSKYHSVENSRGYFAFFQVDMIQN